MKSSRALAVAAIASLTFAALAQAQTPPPRRDGPPPGALFVSPMGQPFRAAPESHRAPILLWLAQADADHDERISRDEFVADAMTFFMGTLDANRDGGATSVESTELWRTQAPEMLSRRTEPARVAAPQEQRGRPRGARGGGTIGVDRGERRAPPPGADGPPPERRAQIMLGDDVEPVMSCDRDFSRRIDRAEFEACAVRRFTALDINNDGFFSLFESERAREMIEQAEARAAR